MPYAGKVSVLLIAAGVTLGVLLGDAANPEPKDPPQQWWQVADSEAYTAPVAESGWDNIWGNSAGFPDSYRPDLDYDAMITSYWEPSADQEWYDDHEGERDSDAFSTEPSDQAVPPVVAEAAADAAEQVADAAAVAAEASPTADAAIAPEAPLTSEGLY